MTSVASRITKLLFNNLSKAGSWPRAKFNYNMIGKLFVTQTTKRCGSVTLNKTNNSSSSSLKVFEQIARKN